MAVKQQPLVRVGIALAIAGVVVGAVAGWALSRSTTRSPDAGRQEVAGDSEARLRQAEARLDRLASAVRQQQDLPRRPAPRSPPLGLPEDPSNRQAKARAVATVYQQTFDATTRDPAFEAKALRQAEAAMDAEALKMVAATPEDVDINCRGQLCRLEAAFPTASDASEWATYYAMALTDVLPNSRTFMLPGEHGTTRMQLYLFSARGAGTMAEIDRQSW